MCTCVCVGEGTKNRQQKIKNKRERERECRDKILVLALDIGKKNVNVTLFHYFKLQQAKIIDANHSKHTEWRKVKTTACNNLETKSNHEKCGEEEKR